MAKAMIFRIDGLDDLLKQLEELGDAVDNDEAESACESGAKIIADDIRARAPQGPTGNLRKSVIAKRLKGRLGRPVPSIVAIDYRKGPHAHLVEYGTGPRTVRKKKVMADVDTGQVFGTQVAAMPAKPFFRPGVDAKSNAALEHISKRLEDLIAKAVGGG